MKLNLLTIAILSLVAAGCYDESDPVAKLQTPTDKGYYPVSANTFVDLTNGGTISANRIYAPNVNLSFELQYWSVDPVQEINVYATVGAGAKTKIFSKPYSEIAAYSKLKSADTLVVAYKTPVVAAETTVKLDVEIVNQNTLSLTRPITIKAKP
ncbi:MAG TPA: hypothetical protein VGD65_03575 [Chryseosolibacter sp.]